jgi:hypothetical protein
MTMGTSVIEQAVTETPVVETPVVETPVVPESYDLKVPDGSTVDSAFVDRTAAKARELGLTNEAAQKLFDSEVKDATERETASQAALAKAKADSQKALLDAWAPNGAEWKKQQDEWTKLSKADSAIGGEKFNQAVESAGQAVERFGDPELKKMLEETGFGRHPVVLRFLSKIGAASRESTFANGGAPTGGTETSMVNRWYGKTTPE